MAECALIQSNESFGGFRTRWDAVDDVEFGAEGGVLVGPSMSAFLSYLTFVQATYIR